MANSRPSNVVRLADMHTDGDSKQLLARLASEAASGELVGTVVIAMYRPASDRKLYKLSMSGRAASDATFAAGAMSACQMLLQQEALEQAGLVEQ